MVIWELEWDGEGDFYATKREALHAKKGDLGSATLLRHEIKPGREGLVKFLNHNFGALWGVRKRDW